MIKRTAKPARPRLRRWVATFALGQSAALAFAIGLTGLTFQPVHADAQIAVANLVLMVWPWLLVFAITDKALGTPKIRILVAVIVVAIYGFSALVANLRLPSVSECTVLERVGPVTRYRCVLDESRVSIFEARDGEMTMKLIETLE